MWQRFDTILLVSCSLLLSFLGSVQGQPSVQPGLLQSSPFAGNQPIDVCHIPETDMLYIVDALSGNTHVYNRMVLANGPILTIPNPAGAVATTGIASDGTFLYWAVPGAPQTLWRTDLLGNSPTALGHIQLPGLGTVVGLCLDTDGNLWANDVISDQYSKHSVADGSAMGPTISHPDGMGSGNGIAFRSDCGSFEVAHGPNSDGLVTRIETVTNPEGIPINGIDVSFIGPQINGIEALESGSTGEYSLIVLEASTNHIYEVKGLPACPSAEIPEPRDLIRCSNPVGPASTICGPTSLAATITDSGPLLAELVPTEGFSIGSLEIFVDLLHPMPNELKLILSSPSGTSITLHDGFGIEPNLQVTFDDEGAPYGSASLSNGIPTRPAGPGLLSAFNGESFSGSWILSVFDSAVGNDGTLESWCLVATPVPGLSISPVATPVVDTIEVTEGSTTIRDLNVSLDIAHPFIADLSVSLTGPTGINLTLHDQSIVSGESLQITYDDDGFGNIPDGPGLLSDFEGSESNGTWTLECTDFFEGSEGSLRNWCIAIDEFTKRNLCHVPPRASDCQSPAISISHLSPTVSTLQTMLTGPIHDLDVALDIQHSWIGDLNISIESPAATSVSLLNAGGGNINNITTTFDDEGQPFSPSALPLSKSVQPQGPGALSDFDNETVSGEWTLSIGDVSTSDDGQLNSWCLDNQTPLQISHSLSNLTIPFEVTDDAVVEEVELQIGIEHSLNRQLQMSLRSPTGTVVVLKTVSTTGLGNVDVTYAADGIPFDAALLSDGIRMQPSLGNMLEYFGEPMIGTWTLTIIDAMAGADGFLKSACLTVFGDEAPCEPTTLLPLADAINGPNPLTVNFTANLAGTGPFDVLWNFGDGTTEFIPNPTHTFLQEGVYTVTITAQNACGSDTVSLLIHVCNPISTSLTTNVISGPPPLTVDFNPNVTGSQPMSFEWNFGDGATSSEVAPMYVYNQPGSYLVTMTGSNACGTTEESLLINVCDPVLATPSVMSSNLDPIFAFEFSANATGSGPFFYQWIFGDGHTSILSNPIHTYQAAGNYVVTLVISNPCGEVTHVLPVTVCEPVASNATASSVFGYIPLTVEFLANASGSGPIQHFWDFGDGSTSDQINPIHTYSTEGTFEATLTATNDCGTTTQSLTISTCSPVQANLVATPTTGTSPLTVAFDSNATGTGPITSLWAFGDGQFSTELSPTHTYLNDGVYEVTVEVFNSCGSQSATLVIEICDEATSSPTSNINLGLVPLTVDFDAFEGGTLPRTTVWNFGDGQEAVGSFVSHTFTIPGTYVVTSSTSNGCGVSSGTIEIVVCDLPQVSIEATPAPDSPMAITFSGNVVSDGTFDFVWNFGDGVNSSEISPQHVYAEPGVYNVTLSVNNPCTSVSTSMEVAICPPTTADFATNTTFGIAPYCASFTDLTTGPAESYVWSFGDGTTSTTIGSVSHVFQEPGLFDVSLTVTTNCSLTDSKLMSQLVQVLVPGDVNQDGMRDVTDPIALLSYVFGFTSAPSCQRIADVNADNFIDISDAIYLLFWQFSGGPDPIGPTCGSCEF